MSSSAGPLAAPTSNFTGGWLSRHCMSAPGVAPAWGSMLLPHRVQNIQLCCLLLLNGPNLRLKIWVCWGQTFQSCMSLLFNLVAFFFKDVHQFLCCSHP